MNWADDAAEEAHMINVIAHVIDPQAFEPWEPKSDRHKRLRGLQMAARQAQALVHARRVYDWAFAPVKNGEEAL